MAGRQIDQLLADEAADLVEGNFTGVEAEWWWERRLDGGIAICQEFSPEAMIFEIAEAMGRDVAEVRQAAVRSLALQDFEPVTLTHDIEWDTEEREAAKRLRQRSTTATGLADKLYQQVAAALREG